jgi:hypothetical protein
MRHLLWPMSRIELVARLVAVFSLLLFLGTLWGHYQIHDRDNLTPIMRDVRSMDALAALAKTENPAAWNTLTDRQKMDAWYDAIGERLVHGQSSHGFFSNWIMWGLGKLNVNAGMARNPDVVLRTQASALCSEASFLMVEAARREGLEARHVGLNGHVVAEIKTDDAWQLYDPDMKVRSGFGKDEAPLEDFNIETLAADKDLAEKVYPAKYAAMIISTDDNKIGAPYQQFNVGAQQLMQGERLAEWLKFGIPCAMFLISLGVVHWAKKRTKPI